MKTITSRSGDASANGIEVLLTLADELCAAAATVLVVDDLQWADEASLTVWHELAASISQLRLLLIGTSRPAPHRPEVQQVRTAVVGGSGQVVRLGPLAEPDAIALVTAMVGAVPGEGLRGLAAQAVGNPLYLCELVDALMREQAVEIRPVADNVSRSEQLPPSLPVVLDGRLSSVSEEAAQLLRAAALLGGRFAVSDLSVVRHRPVVDLAAGLREAVGAGIVDGPGAELAMFEREVTGVDASYTLAHQALTAAEEAGDLSTTAQALVAVWLINSVGRDHAAGPWPGRVDRRAPGPAHHSRPAPQGRLAHQVRALC